MEYISVDAHKRYSFVSIENQQGKVCWKHAPSGNSDFLPA
jgi:predicted DCC family thiol-disulfide oxidoreductase YuxK